MKTALEILNEKLNWDNFVKQDPEIARIILQCMKEYAEEAIELCEENAQTTESPAYNTIVDKRSILNMKKLLK